MSDTGTPAADPTPTAPSGETVSRAEFERLQNENKTYRERFQPFERAFGQLDPKDRDSFLSFVQSYAAGDADTASAWLIDSARNIAGDRFRELVGDGATQAQAANIIVAEQQAGQQLTPDQVAALVDEKVSSRLAEENRQRIIADAVSRLGRLGVDSNSHHAAAILHLATANHGGDIEAAYGAYVASANELTANENARRALALSRLGNSAPAPDGTPMPTIDPARLSTREGRRAALREQIANLNRGPR